MRFLHKKKNPSIYLAETTQYVKDLQQIMLLRSKTTDLKEIEEFNNIIHCMQEVLIFMNSIHIKDRNRLVK